jgi:putative transposase
VIVHVHDDWAPVRAAVAAQQADLDSLLQVVVARLRADVPEYALVPDDSLRSLCRRNVTTGLSAYADRRCFTAEEVADIVSTVGARAAQGVPLDAVLRAFRLVEDESFGDVEGRLVDASATTLRELWSTRFANMEEMTRAAATIHRAVELEQAAELQARQALALQALLTGGLTEAEGAATLSRLGMDPGKPHWVWSLRATGDQNRVLRELAGGEVRAPRAVFTTWDDLAVGLSAEPPPSDLSLADGGVAGPALVSEIHQAYREAEQARRTAEAFGLRGVRARRELTLRAAVVEEPAVGEALVDKYVVPLRSAGSLADDLLVSVRVFLQHGGRRDAAARALHLHPNTLAYRISRFVHFTGASLEDHDVTAELWWLFRHLEVTQP